MWSGPRNISTALMRSWGNRADTAVIDEPLYAYYLKTTGLDHPGAGEVIAAHEADWRRVVADLTGPIPDGRLIYYQKQMAHHLLPEVGRDWLAGLSHAFLIREPREMLTSLMKVLPDPRLEDTGLPQQVEIFERVRERTGKVPPVVDSRDVLDRPADLLPALCDAIGVRFDEAMLNWPPGPRATDGAWAKYWYESVNQSTNFQPFRPKSDEVPDRLVAVLERCTPLYQKLAEHRLRA